MSQTLTESRPTGRYWAATVCGVLLLATFLNYSNRFTFTQNTTPIQQELTRYDSKTSKIVPLGEVGYGIAAGRFAMGFACGGLLFGVLADYISVRWLYPLVVVVWSLAGMASGAMETLFGLSVCRFVLGLFEAGHWPCALRTTQRIFKPAQRTLANSILQSGASLGAVLTPLLVVALHEYDPASWRLSFYLIGFIGLPWAVIWLRTVKEADVQQTVIQTDESAAGTSGDRPLEEVPFLQIFFTRRWWLLLLTVNCINVVWHYVRVWMPDTLENDLGYSREFVGYFTAVYYAATFVGSLASGSLISLLSQRGWNVHRARMATFLLFSLLTGASIPAALWLGGYWYLGTMLLVGFGSLGLFPIYYSLTQEISAKHQGKVGGTLSFATWSLLSVLHPLIGEWVSKTPEIRPALLATLGAAPMLATLVLYLCWGHRPASVARNR